MNDHHLVWVTKPETEPGLSPHLALLPFFCPTNLNLTCLPVQKAGSVATIHGLCVKMSSTQHQLLKRSIRTLAWLGDAQFEWLVRQRLAQLGDYPVDRLNRLKTKIVSAGGQSQILQAIEHKLDEHEMAIVRRARNSVRSVPRGTEVRDYRNATALEALVCYWSLTAAEKRLAQLLSPQLKTALEK